MIDKKMDKINVFWKCTHENILISLNKLTPNINSRNIFHQKDENELHFLFGNTFHCGLKGKLLLSSIASIKINTITKIYVQTLDVNWGSSVFSMKLLYCASLSHFIYSINAPNNFYMYIVYFFSFKTVFRYVVVRLQLFMKG